MVTRRNLFKTAAFGALSQGLMAKQAQALAQAVGLGERDPANKEPHFFVFVQMQGAWDPCLAFDPKDREAKLPNGDRAFDQPYSMADVRTFGGLPLAPQGYILGKYADRMAIVNGIDMEVDTGHIPDVIMTGMLQPKQSGAPYIQAILGKRQPYVKHCSIPHIYTTYDGQFFAGGYGNSSVTASPADIVTMMGLGGTPGASTLPQLRSLLQDYQQELTDAGERRTFQSYLSAVPGAGSLMAKLHSGNFVLPADATTAAGMGQLFGQLFALGVVGAISWQLGLGGAAAYNFDTHANHFALHPLGKAMADVATLATELAKIPLDANTSVWDRTTVVLCSEFTRTPRLMSNEGKDHNVHSNTLVALGYKVRPGVFGASGTRVVAGTYEAHAALPVDFATGRPSAQGDLLKTKHVWAGLGALTGVDLSREFGTDAKPVGFFAT